MIEFTVRLNKLLSLNNIEFINLSLSLEINAEMKFPQVLFQMTQHFSLQDLGKRVWQKRNILLIYRIM
jgi:hypothetical protein